MYKVILFDLDGTLTESGEGITMSVQYMHWRESESLNRTLRN